MSLPYRLCSLGLCTTALWVVGCRSVSDKTAEPRVESFGARHAAVPVRVDGVLDDAVWHRADVYPLRLAANIPETSNGPLEEGHARFAWDEEHFHMAVDFADSDIVAEGTRDGLHHYQLGDLAELFLCPESLPWYVELYVTPAGNFSTFLFPSGGRLLPSCTSTNAFALVGAFCFRRVGRIGYRRGVRLS